MPKRTFAPRSRQFNERLIERVQSRYDSGMFRDLEGLNLPTNGIANLINAVAHEHDIQGRLGTELMTPADWGVTLTDFTELLGTSMNSGEMYAASGRNKEEDTVPEEDSIFMVYGDGDTIYDDLETAKGEAPRKYDVFQVISNNLVAASIEYLGNIRLPALEGYGDTVANEITATKSGTTITRSSGPSFGGELRHQYFEWGDGTRDFILSVTDSDNLEVYNSGTKTSTSQCRCVGKINAGWYHQSQRALVLQIGVKLYKANDVPWYEWEEIPCVGSFYALDDSFCRMYEDDDDLVLINASGFYRIKLDTLRYWRMNDAAPVYGDRPADEAEEQPADRTANPIATIEYHYLYAHSRIYNSTHFAYNRTHADSLMEWQSGPTTADPDGQDYFIQFTKKDIGNGLNAPNIDNIKMQFHNRETAQVALSGGYDATAAWQAIVDGVWKLTARVYQITSGVLSYEDISRNSAPMDFSGIESLDDVLTILNSYLNLTWQDIGVRFDCRFYRDGTNIKLQLITLGAGVTMIASSTCDASRGTDLDAIIGLTLSASSGDYFFEPKAIAGFTIPDPVKAATHYALYRTARVDEPGVRAGNNPNKFILVDDVPLVNVFEVTSSSGNNTVTVTTGVVRNCDNENTLVTVGHGSTTISAVHETTNTFLTGAVLGDHTGLACAVGASNVFHASVSSGIMTIAGHSLTGDDVGKPVWFASGEIRWITKILTSYTAEVSGTTNGNISSVAAAMNPTTRTISDTVMDTLFKKVPSYPHLLSRTKLFTLPSRFVKEMPNCNIGTVVPGWIFGTQQGDNKYYFSDTAKDYLAGQYASDLQYNDKIDGAIQEFIHQNDYVGIRTEYGSWRVNLTTVEEVGDTSVGENIDAFKDPEIADNSVGVEGEGGTAILENGNFLTFTSEPSIREFNMLEYGDNLAHNRLQESDIVELEPHVIMMYDHLRGLVLWGRK